LAQIALEVPVSLREMIEAQIERLGLDVQRVLEVASVSGVSFSTLLSPAMTPPDIGLIESVCDRLARRRQIIQFGKAQLLADRRVVQRYEFTHALYREVLYGRQAPATRTILHRRIGEALETAFVSTPDEVAAALAHHFEEGVELEKAVKYLRLAAHTAVRRHAPLEAAANLQHALELTRRLPNATRGLAETEILERLAAMHVVSFDRKAIDAIDVLRARAAHYGLLDMEARALIAMAYPMAWQSAKRGIDVIDQALRLAEQEKDPLARARFRAQCLVRRIWTRGWDSEDAEGCRNALEEIRARGPRNVIAAHVVDCSFVDFCSSQYRKVSRDAAESLAVLIRGDDDDLNSGYARWLAEFTVPWSLLLVGEWGETLRELDRGIVRAEKNGDHYRAQTLHLYQAWVQLHAMDLDTAAKTCESVLPGFQDRASTPWRRLCLTIYGAAEAGRNNHAHAHALLRAAKDEMNDRAVIHDWYCRLLLQWALANLWLAQGDLTRAREESNEFLKLTEATAERTWQGLAWDVNARVATALGETQRAARCVAQGLAAIEGYEAPLAIWPLHATAARLSTAIGDLGNAERHIETTRATILALAASLDSHESLRTTFLMAPSVANALTATDVD
jgi:tetratricopeptide (TPR) repeat protein